MLWTRPLIQLVRIARWKGIILALLLPLGAASAKAVVINSIAVGDSQLHFALCDVQARQSIQLRECRPYQEMEADGVVAWEGPAERRIAIPRFHGKRDRTYNRFQLVDGNTGCPVSAQRCADDLDRLSAPSHRLEWPADIKGLSCPVDFDDLVELGVKHVHINVSPAWAFAADSSGKDDPEFRWEVDGELFTFNAPYFQELDRQVGRMTRDGVNVVAVVMLHLPSPAGPNHPLVNLRTDLNSPHSIGAFNLSDEPGLRRFVAFMGYIANRYSRNNGPNGIISGYIIGNEIDTHWEWHNMGLATIEQVVEQHADELRMAYYAVRMQHPDIRIFTSLTHCWNVANLPDPRKSIPGRELLERLNERIASQGAVPWNLAYHPYPQDLFQPRFWNDELATFDDDTPMITLKNIEVLLDYLGQERFAYRGERRRLILSEQGFHAGDSSQDEQIQAAAYALAYCRLRALPNIDAFILHRHADHREEGGLKLGLWTADPEATFPSQPDRKRPIWNVFQAAGTARQDEAFAFALPIVGLKSWSDVNPRR